MEKAAGGGHLNLSAREEEMGGTLVLAGQPT